MRDRPKDPGLSVCAEMSHKKKMNDTIRTTASVAQVVIAATLMGREFSSSL